MDSSSKVKGMVGKRFAATKDHRFQIIGLDQQLRSKFLATCKLNNKSGNSVLKQFMVDYIKLHNES